MTERARIIPTSRPIADPLSSPLTDDHAAQAAMSPNAEQTPGKPLGKPIAIPVRHQPAQDRSARWLPEDLPPRLASGRLIDTRGRRLHDLRISVTDRCNFRCTYCMPKSVFDKNYPFLPHDALLSFEEIVRVARLAVDQGVEKIRITGGEPLLRRHIETLISMLAQLRTPSGKAPELTLTTNGALLGKKAQALRDAGLNRVTVSLDAMDDTVFQRMNDVEFPVGKVLDSIAQASEVGFKQIKVNMVVKKGTNDQEILPMVRYFKGSGHIVRFIEYMDVGSSNGWKMDEVVPSADVVALINSEFALQCADPNYQGEVAERWQFKDGSGEIGVISSVTQAFCSTCTRARLSTDGKIYTCLFASDGFDLRSMLRAGADDATMQAALGWIWERRGDRYSEIRTEASQFRRKVEMSFIGG